ncbi:hypothetical protein MTR_7g033290 [Medicago truncatula]|uniref:Uncharacterized protein n=1 Tax=Medicago truncatula TaxID=3880 RepID=A0A072TZ16_MEDTR|nr:hypothetical protein MTR_7g033290 [Medicago truncatula]
MGNLQHARLWNYSDVYLLFNCFWVTGCYNLVSEQNLEMTGSSDAALVAALEAVAQAVQQQPKVETGNDGTRMLETFLRNHPPTFKGRYAPDGA